MLIHQARNGKLLVWDGKTLQETKSVSYKDLKRLIDRKKITQKSKDSLLRKLKKLTEVEGELPYDNQQGSMYPEIVPGDFQNPPEAPKRTRR